MGAHQMGSRWGTVAASVMRRPGLSVAAKAVYAALATYADRVGWIWVRQETIASDLERSRAWVHAAIAELEEQGLLLHDRQYIEGRQRASRYQLQDGLARRRTDDAEVSEQADAAVKPADTSHHDESKDSFSGFARESAPELAGPVPADWVPTVDDMAWARSRHPNLDILAFTETFVLSCQAKGYRYADPSAAWRRWLIEPKGKLPQLPAAATTPAQEPAHETRTTKPRNRGSANPPVPTGSSLADANHRRAAACLDRLMGRRTGDPSTGHAG
jgi:hypothetical protein